MLLYGEKKRGNKSFKIQDLTIACNIEELDKLIYFLSYARVYMCGLKYQEHDDIIKAGEKILFPHKHYRDWDKNWKEEDSDFIVNIPFKASIDENGEVEWVDMTPEELKALEDKK